MHTNENAADHHSAARRWDAGMASMYLHCSTFPQGVFLYDLKKVGVC